MALIRPGFPRTVCGCSDCTAFCKKSPGHLIPSDLFRLADFLLDRGKITETINITDFLQASAGAIVGDTKTGERYRIGTIIPKRVNGQCIFLTEDDLCSIHEVSPFGCAYFDVHMDAVEGHVRSKWGIEQIASAPAYEQVRQILIERDGGQYEPFPSKEET